ncbi:cytokine receptor common subunit gamma [Pyxicephalus adspersus]|uniref:cytokine receptor common subunit gamma n=1 Tax=Pyxicephalus adspersus TaxID=30357 RepID=UPI003B5A6D72
MIMASDRQQKKVILIVLNFVIFRTGTKDPKIACPQYMVTNSTNIGCKLPISQPYETLNVELKRGSPGSAILVVLKKPQDYVKMDPPSKLKLEVTSNQELILRWEQSFGKIRDSCVMYRVKHRTTASDSWTEKDASSTFSSLPSFDICHNYTFHVKSKINNYCADSLMWSEWSEGVTWARNATVCEGQQTTKPPSQFLHTGITVGLTLLLVVIFLAVIGQERIWVILVPQIPNPAKKFEDLINGCNVQEWVGVSKEAVEKMKLNYTETLCTVTEDSDCPGTEGKSLTSPPPEI